MLENGILLPKNTWIMTAVYQINLLRQIDLLNYGKLICKNRSMQ